MGFKYFNPHPRGLIVGDCVKRSLVAATEWPYRTVQRELNDYKKNTGARYFNTDYNPHKFVEKVLRAKKICFRRKITAAEFCKEYPVGRYILDMDDHWTAVIDSVIYDTFDPSDMLVVRAYKMKNESHNTPV